VKEDDENKKAVNPVPFFKGWAFSEKAESCAKAVMLTAIQSSACETHDP
jgi:hypothetical protein